MNSTAMRNDLAAPHARLLMVRKAGASFVSNLNIHSPIFEAVLKEYEIAGAKLEHLCEQLVEQIHAAVPQTDERAQRNLLLKIKRAVFNRRPISSLEALHLGPLQEHVFQYTALLKRRTELLNSSRHEVFCELRHQLTKLLQNDDFCTALNYSCPWLLGKYQREGKGDEFGYSNAERTIHAYATKFFSKANPFYTFASVGFPSTNQVVDNYCELILNTSLLMDLEQSLLKAVKDPYRRLAYLRPFLYRENTFRFIIVDNLRLRLISAKYHPLLRRVITFFEDQGRQHTIGSCVDFVLEAFSAIERVRIEAYLDFLIKQGVIIEYLIKDFDSFSDDLLGLSVEQDELLLELQRLHLACVHRAALPAIHQRLQAICLDEPATSTNLYYVNTYEQGHTDQHEPLMFRVQEDLRDLKQFFTVSNFFERAYIIRAFLRDRVMATPKGEAPYLELICEFLRNFTEIIKTYQPFVHRDRQEQNAIANWMRSLSNCAGQLKRGDLNELLAERPSAVIDFPVVESLPYSVCFNGSCDYVKGIYYLTNVFAGKGRYASRYLLHQSAKHYPLLLTDDEWLDVQLVATFKDNRTYVVAIFPTGCGFEARYRHYFERWIDPSTIMVGMRDGRVVYRDGPTGRLLRFHFFGFVLAHYLTAGYQLLLADHADTYLNLFEQNPVTLSDQNKPAIKHIPSLYYGAVCLRREQWAFSKSILEKACDRDDILSCTAKLREWLHINMHTEEDELYFRSWSPSDGSSPRYLDLRNPLGVQTFRKFLLQLPNDSMVSFARMEPPASNLYMENQRPFLTELMIEV